MLQKAVPGQLPLPCGGGEACWESNLNPQLSAQSQKPRHRTTGRRVLLHEMFCELSFVMASTTITDPPVSVDGLLT